MPVVKKYEDYDEDETRPRAPKKPWEDPGYTDEPDAADTPSRPSVANPVAPVQNRPRTLGIGENVLPAGFDPLSAAREILRGSGTVKIIWDNFTRGIMTTYKRGTQPNGSVYDCKNFVPNVQIGALTQRYGYSSYITAPVTLVDGSSVGQIDFHWHLGTDNPTSTSIDLIGFSTGFAQKPFFKESTTATSSWVQLGELKSTTIASIAGDLLTFVLTDGSASNDYYNTWIVHNSTRSEHLYITDYVGASKTVTPLEKVPSDWIAGDTIVLYRHFHDNVGFAPSVGTDPCAVQLGDILVVSGGQGAGAGRKPIFSGYVDLTFFSGATKTPQFQGTCVTESEVKTTGMTLGNATTFASVGNGLDIDKTWFVAYLYETVDGQLSTLQLPGTNYTTVAADQGLQAALTIGFARWNKRIKKIQVFMGSVDSTGAPTTLDWSEYKHVKTIDLTSTGWTYTDSTTTPGSFAYTLQLDNRDWEGKNVKSDGTFENVVDWTGTTEYNRSTVSFSRAVVINNRLFVAKAYDYNLAKNLDDYILWTGFSGVLGTPQLSVFPDIDGESQARITSGNTPAVIGLARWQSRLFVLKEGSCHEINVANADPKNWQIINLSSEVGCDIPHSIVETPNGVCFARSGDDIYLYRGGQPVSLTSDTIRPTFRTNTGDLSSAEKLQLWGWYDSRWQAYCVMINEDDLSEFWGTFFELPVSDTNFAWYRFDITAGINSVRLDKNGNVLFSATNIYKMTDSDLDDGGTTIKLYLDTGEHVFGETDILSLSKWWMANQQDASATTAGTLDVQIKLDNAVVTYDSVPSEKSALTKTSNRWRSGLPRGAKGRTYRFLFNTDGTPATWTPSTATAQQFQILEIGLIGKVKELYGDKSRSL